MDLENRRIAVTGATGFLGRYVVNALADRKAIPIGVVRNPERVPELREAGIELRRADLSDPEALERGFAGCDGIASVAAMVSLSSMYTLRHARREEYIRTNVRGLGNVFAAAHAAGVRRIVHVSSANVYADRTRPIREDHALHDPGGSALITNAYSASKAAAERLAWQLAKEKDLALTTLRPTGIFGAHDPSVMRWARRLLWPAIALWPAGTQIQFVYAGDVAEALLRSFESDAAIGEAYNVAGGDESLWDFARAWKAAGGARARVLIPIPIPIRPLFDTSKIRREIGWSPRSVADSLQETFAREADHGKP